MDKFLRWWLICAVILLIVLAYIGYRKNDSRKEINIRMKLVETGSDYKIYVDTNTGLCYLFSGKEPVIMLDHDGSPYVENGWRDYE